MPLQLLQKDFFSIEIADIPMYNLVSLKLQRQKIVLKKGKPICKGVRIIIKRLLGIETAAESRYQIVPLDTKSFSTFRQPGGKLAVELTIICYNRLTWTEIPRSPIVLSSLSARHPDVYVCNNRVWPRLCSGGRQQHSGPGNRVCVHNSVYGALYPIISLLDSSFDTRSYSVGPIAYGYEPKQREECAVYLCHGQKCERWLALTVL